MCRRLPARQFRGLARRRQSVGAGLQCAERAMSILYSRSAATGCVTPDIELRDLPVTATAAQASAIPDPADASPPLPSRSSSDRRMVRAELLGHHEHETPGGTTVLVYVRNGRFLARGSWNGGRFGETLPAGEADAKARLCQIIAEIGAGTYVPPSQASRRLVRRGLSPRLSVRDIAANYLDNIRDRRGRKTAADYKARLMPVLEFAERRDVRLRCPAAVDIDVKWATDLRTFLYDRKVTPNGHPMAAARPMSARQVHNVLSTVAMMLNHARDPRVNRLPLTFTNPFTRELVGTRPGAILWSHPGCRSPRGSRS